MREHIEHRVDQLRQERAVRASIQAAIDELLLDGLIEWTGEYRDGSPVYRAVGGDA